MLEAVKKDLVLEQARVADLEQMLQSGTTLEGQPESVEGSSVPQQGMQELMAIREDLEGQLEELSEEVHTTAACTAQLLWLLGLILWPIVLLMLIVRCVLAECAMSMQ